MLDSWTLSTFKRLSTEPLLSPDPEASFACPMTGDRVRWRCANVFNPAATVVDGKVYLVFRAEDGTGTGIGRHTSRLGLAWSADGLSFEALPEPVLFPDDDSARPFEWTGGCEDPRMVKSPEGGYLLTYTAWDRNCARLSAATSKDLVHWTKHGPVFAKTADGAWLGNWSKAGSIVCELVDGDLVAKRIRGRYWMYWGEGSIYAATSANLLDWAPVVDGDGRLVEVLRPRTCMFDSELVEPGPPAILTSRGIVLVYNGKNDWAVGDPTLTAGAYCPGQALLDGDDPTHWIDRTNLPFLRPELPFETTGQYEPGTVFTEGLVPFGGKWMLYYGCGDSAIGAAWAPRRG